MLIISAATVTGVVAVEMVAHGARPDRWSSAMRRHSCASSFLGCLEHLHSYQHRDLRQRCLWLNMTCCNLSPCHGPNPPRLGRLLCHSAPQDASCRISALAKPEEHMQMSANGPEMKTSIVMCPWAPSLRMLLVKQIRTVTVGCADPPRRSSSTSLWGTLVGGKAMGDNLVAREVECQAPNIRRRCHWCSL